jgi:hypothetical protein
LEIVLGLIAPRGFKSRILRSDQRKIRPALISAYGGAASGSQTRLGRAVSSQANHRPDATAAGLSLQNAARSRPWQWCPKTSSASLPIAILQNPLLMAVPTNL